MVRNDDALDVAERNVAVWRVGCREINAEAFAGEAGACAGCGQTECGHGVWEQASLRVSRVEAGILRALWCAGGRHSGGVRDTEATRDACFYTGLSEDARGCFAGAGEVFGRNDSGYRGDGSEKCGHVVCETYEGNRVRAGIERVQEIGDCAKNDSAGPSRCAFVAECVDENEGLFSEFAAEETS